ncbi:MAG: endo-1,4-beta-xylanase [Nocardioides sp.]
MSRRHALLLPIGAGVGAAVAAAGSPASGADLRRSMQADVDAPDSSGAGGLNGLAAPTIIGSHTNFGNLFGNDGPIIEREMGLVSTAQHWAQSWTGPGAFDPTLMGEHDQIVDWADEREMLVHAWLCFGAQHYLPDWLQQGAASMGEAELTEHMRTAMKAVAASGGNAEQVDYWTVVNEPFRPEGTWVDTLWNALGVEPDRSGLSGEEAPLEDQAVYVRTAFELAAEVLPGKLGLRENRMEFPGMSKYASTYQLVTHLLAVGVRLEVIEFQMHMNAYPAGQVPDDYPAQAPDGSYNWDGFKQNVDRYHELGLEVHLGEVDFYTSGFEVGSEEARQAQAEAAYGLARAAREAGVELITHWGLRENSMDRQANDNATQIYLADGTPKPAYDGFRRGLEETQSLVQDESSSGAAQPPVSVPR